MRVSRVNQEALEDALTAEHELREAGVIEPDEPAPATTAEHQRRVREHWGRDFTAEERFEIRARLGLLALPDDLAGRS